MYLSFYPAGWVTSSRTWLVRCSCWRRESIPAGTPGPTATGVTASCPSGPSKWWVGISLLGFFTPHFLSKCWFLSSSICTSHPSSIGTLQKVLFMAAVKCVFIGSFHWQYFWIKAFIGWHIFHATMFKFDYVQTKKNLCFPQKVIDWTFVVLNLFIGSNLGQRAAPTASAASVWKVVNSY